MIVKVGVNKGKDKWEVLCSKYNTHGESWNKDERGKIQHNYHLMQRLGKNSPYGYKLAQVYSCIDIIENEDKIYDYRLNTSFTNIEEVDPFYTYQRKSRGNILKKKDEGQIIRVS
jgi:hypothetical protein